MDRPELDSIIYWLRSFSHDSKDRVPMYFKGMCDRRDEGMVGFDVKARPVDLGPGRYTGTYNGNDFETEDGTPIEF